MSGVSFTGGTARCWHDWQKFLDCYTAQSTEDPKSCSLLAEDYAECLHHSKEKARARQIHAEFERKQKAGEDVPSSTTQSHLRTHLQDLELIK